MKIRLTTTNFYLAVVLVMAAALLWGGSKQAWSRRHKNIPLPRPTPAVQPSSPDLPTSLVPGDDTAKPSQAEEEGEAKRDSLAQEQDLHYPIRVLIYQGSHPIKVRGLAEPSPALYPASCQLASPNLIIDGKFSPASEYEISAKDKGKMFSCAAGYGLQVGTTLYRGCLKVESEADTFRLINWVSLEDYLRGVVPKELLCSSPEAVKAQAVVARTYALARRLSNKTYDVDCGTNSQVYAGASAEAAISDQAVAETSGLVLTYQGRLADQTLYHSACGGKTESPLYVYGSNSEPYLVSVDCLNDQGEADCAASPYASWQASWSKEELGQELSRYCGKKKGSVAGLEVIEQGPSGRISKLKVHFEDSLELLLEYGAIRSALRFKDMSGAKRSLPSAKFTITEGLWANLETQKACPKPTGPIMGQVLDLLGTEKAWEEDIAELRQLGEKSEAVVLSGQGWGHGIGMCQWGAIGMAKRGQHYSQILARYFVNTQIDSLENLGLTP